MERVVEEIEGPWEDVRGHDAELSGKRVRVQVLEGAPVDRLLELRRLLRETQEKSNPVTDKEIEAEVTAVRNKRA